MAGSTRTGCRHLRPVPRGAAGFDLRRAARADAATQLGGDGPARHAAQPADARSRRPAGLLRLPRPHLAGEGDRARDPHRPRRRARSCRSPRRSARKTRRTITKSSRRCSAAMLSSSWAKSTTRRSLLPLRRQGAAVPDRLAGAVRPGHDRGDGLRLPGDRLPPRLRARGGGGGRDRLRRRRCREAVAACAPAGRDSTARRCASASRQRWTARRMAEDYLALYQRLLVRRGDAARWSRHGD